MKSIHIEIDGALAERYRRAYSKAFPSKTTDRTTIREVIACFLEDRLREEIEFVEEELEQR